MSGTLLSGKMMSFRQSAQQHKARYLQWLIWLLVLLVAALARWA